MGVDEPENGAYHALPAESDVYHKLSSPQGTPQLRPADDDEKKVGLRDYWDIIVHNPKYRYLWLSGGVSNAGDMFNTIATITTLERYTSSSIALSLFLVIRLVAPTIVAPVSGVVVDRMKPIQIMILADLLRAIVVCCFLLVRSADMVWVLYLVSFIQFSLYSFFDPARQAIIPDLVSRSQLVAANAMDSATWSITTLIGSSLGGIVSNRYGSDVNYIADSLSYVLSGLFLIFLMCAPDTKTMADSSLNNSGAVGEVVSSLIRSPSTSPEKDLKVPMSPVAENKKESMNGCAMYLSGMKYMLLVKRDVFWLTVFKASGNIVLGVADVVNVRLAETEFTLGQKDALGNKDGSLGLSLLYGVGGVGCIVGPVVANLIASPTPIGFRRSMGVSFFVLTVGTAIAGWSPNVYWWCFGNFLLDASNAVVYMLLTAVLQMEVEAQYRGRVFAFGMGVRTLVSAGGTLGSAVLLDEHLANNHEVMFYSSFIVLLTFLAWVLIYYPSFARTLRRQAATLRSLDRTV